MPYRKSVKVSWCDGEIMRTDWPESMRRDRGNKAIWWILVVSLTILFISILLFLS